MDTNAIGYVCSYKGKYSHPPGECQTMGDGRRATDGANRLSSLPPNNPIGLLLPPTDRVNYPLAPRISTSLAPAQTPHRGIHAARKLGFNVSGASKEGEG